MCMDYFQVVDFSIKKNYIFDKTNKTIFLIKQITRFCDCTAIYN
jgi:hypothetical protein